MKKYLIKMMVSALIAVILLFAGLLIPVIWVKIVIINLQLLLMLFIIITFAKGPRED